MDFSGFGYFFEDFSGCFAVAGELFCGFQRFQLLFSRIFPAFGLDWGEGIGTKQKREQSDYDDFFIASKEEAQKQFDNAESIVAAIIEYMRKNNSGTII